MTATLIRYHDTWKSVFRANWIHDGPRGSRRLLPRADRPFNTDLERIEELAAQLAAAEHRAPVERDLKHATTTVALGLPKDSKHFTWRDTNALLDFFQTLINPGDLATAVKILDPAAAHRAEMLAKINNHCLLGYVISESLRLHDTRDFANLPPAQFVKFYQHLHARPNAWKPGHAPRVRRPKSSPSPGGEGRGEGGRAAGHSVPVPAPDWPDELPSASDPF